jgi:hypothetical protein
MKEKARGLQVLRGHLVRRIPASDELASRVPIALTPRDEEILAAVYAQGFLTSDIIVSALFPAPAGGRRAHSAPAYQRLRQLWLWGFLERVEQPVAPSLGGRRPFLYALGPRAVPLLAARAGAADRDQPVQQRRLTRLDDRALEHDLHAARLWANLRAKVPETRLIGWRWEAERALRARRLRVPDPEGRFPLPFVPDGYAELVYPSGAVQCCVAEVDMGTLPLRRFRRKLRGLEAFLAQGRFERHFRRREFEVLVLAPSPARLRGLRLAARRVVPEARWPHYLFATFEALAAERFPDGWWPLEADDEANRCGLFFEQAWEEGGFGPDGEREGAERAGP